MPLNLSNCSLDLVWILGDHLSFGGNGFSKILSLLSSKVLLKQVDLIVLHNASGGVLGHLLGS